MNINYNGRPDFSRPRKLTEVESVDYFNDNLYGGFTGESEKDAYTDRLFTNLARVYLKGEVLKNGLSRMDPAQFIPIDDSADAVRAAAVRLASDESELGTIITYSMYQRAIDKTLERKWEMRGTIIEGQVPASSYESISQTNKKESGGFDKYGTVLKEFVEQNGIIATLLSVYTSSLFMADIFQGMTVENAAKGIQASKWPIGIVIFLEIGIKAERIIRMLKDAKVNIPNIEDLTNQLEQSPDARAEAFAGIGIDYDDFKKSQEYKDSDTIVRYVSDYCTRFGGLDRPNGQLTLDHWVAYAQVAQNQQILRGGLNTSSLFSPKFISYRDLVDPPLSQSLPQQQGLFAGAGTRLDKKALILNELASMVQSSSSMSDRMYDDILSVFSSVDAILSDQILCCVVQIFGTLGDPDLLRALSYVLKMLAIGFGSELSRAFNSVLRLLSTLLVDAIFELIAKLNQFYQKILAKLSDIFTVKIDNYPACTIVLSIGWAILASIDALFKQIMTLLKELANYISAWGTFANFKWELTADRRLLLGIARVLEMLAGKLEMANACALPQRNVTTQIGEFDNPDTTIDEAIFSIIGYREPSIEIKTEDINKHFPNITLRESSNLKFKYGIRSLQNNETANRPSCEDPNQREKLEELIKNITTAVQDTFNG